MILHMVEASWGASCNGGRAPTAQCTPVACYRIAYFFGFFVFLWLARIHAAT